jgi:hypothetical protein
MILTVPFQLRRRQTLMRWTYSGDPVFVENSKQLAELTLKHRLPAIAWQREFADAGVLRRTARASASCGGAPRVMLTKS